MNGAAWQPLLKTLHVALVALTGALFALRGAGVLASARWPMAKGVRTASVAIDTLLLSSGVTLWTMLHLDPLRDAWLGVKLLLLPVYIVLGSLALKRAPTPGLRSVFLAAALVVFATMVGIALTHDPLGFWRVS
jgi:uncharacterized membrane protein SirB2